ncbi:hypothetical protein [Pseudomonas sp. EMN2]|uniref:hypothetical protein n=1 Tax=Pseudomonas sp. EMN2 TaxID=2615212 RepID=UPI00129AD435|nr:hypothetical protein [Pseudomonas sp. EMN2]
MLTFLYRQLRWHFDWILLAVDDAIDRASAQLKDLSHRDWKAINEADRTGAHEGAVLDGSNLITPGEEQLESLIR